MINDMDADFLTRNYVFDFEIEQIANATYADGRNQDINVHSEVMREFVRERRQWAEEMIENGYGYEDLLDFVTAYYNSSPKNTIFDFIKIASGEARPGKHRAFSDVVRDYNARQGLGRIGYRTI